MTPEPRSEKGSHRGSGKLQYRVAIITGGDSGIGRAVAVAFAKEGADCAVVYLDEHADAKETKRQVEEKGCRCILISGDVGEEGFCQEVAQRTLDRFGRIDVLVNNAAEQHEAERLEDITREQLERTFRTNIFSMFFLTKGALPHMKEGSTIVNTTSVTAYRGSPICSIIRRPKEPSSPSRARSPGASRNAKSGSTASRPVLSGRPSSRRVLTQNMCSSSAPTRRSAGPASPMKLRLVTYSSPLMIPPI